MQNIELKARVKDLKILRNTAAKIGAAFAGKDRQIDTYFNVPEGRLKLRESSLSGNELIVYFRSDDKSSRKSDYEKFRIYDAARLKTALGRTLGIKGVVAKEREIFQLGPTRIHLDAVEKLGHFIEFEVELSRMEEEENIDPAKNIEMLISFFDIKPESIVGCSYIDLILSEKTDRPEQSE